MTDSPNSRIGQPYRCQDCGSDVGFRSRRRTFTERYVLPLFLMQPVRCGECFRRDYRFIKLLHEFRRYGDEVVDELEQAGGRNQGTRDACDNRQPNGRSGRSQR